MIYLLLVSIAAWPLVFWAGHEWGKRRYRVPMAETGHRDEYLRLENGAWVPYKPPQYVPEGVNPVAAGWEKTRATGIPHHTRRVGD